MILKTCSSFTTVALISLSALAASAQAADAAKPAVDKLPSGVEVTHLTMGKGAKPTAASTVKVHYEGTLANGTVFDSSYKRGEPISFPLTGVIPCWTQGVQTMAVGGVAMLKCPSATAYGARGAGGVIPPNADLTFKVELLAIN
jgi:FKBP-type peptidyl-prolyl cis-trans isomerase FkpA